MSFIELRRGQDSMSGTVVESDLEDAPRGAEVVIQYLGAARDTYELSVNGQTYPAKYAGEAEGVMRYELLPG